LLVCAPVLHYTDAIGCLIDNIMCRVPFATVLIKMGPTAVLDRVNVAYIAL
jgi:hypothetical protein